MAEGKEVVGEMNRNPNFTKDITWTPDPNKTAEIYYRKPFFTFEGRYGIKQWIKKRKNGQYYYVFDAIWLI